MSIPGEESLSHHFSCFSHCQTHHRSYSVSTTIRLGERKSRRRKTSTHFTCAASTKLVELNYRISPCYVPCLPCICHAIWWCDRCSNSYKTLMKSLSIVEDLLYKVVFHFIVNPQFLATLIRIARTKYNRVYTSIVLTRVKYNPGYICVASTHDIPRHCA